jgi:peptidoglycan/LPS O-acetylase OafA/YrhL
LDSVGLLIAVFIALCAALLAGQLLARAGFPIPEAKRRIGCIDGLRGYLALLVMMHHFDLWISRSRLGEPWGASSRVLFHNFGPGGVALFFMVTGLVFYPRIRRGFAKVDWRATYLSRVFRILPLQLVLVGIVVAFSLALGADNERGGLLQNVNGLARWITSYGEPPLFGYHDPGAINAYVLWSLWYEWMFYFFALPLLAWLRDVTRDRLPAMVIPLGTLVVSLVLRPFLHHPAIMFYMPLFACGMIGFELRENPSAARWLTSPWMAASATVLLGLAMIFVKDPYFLPQLAAYALFFCCIAAGNSFGGLFALDGSVVLGEISFGLYILHGLVLFVLFNFIIPTTLPQPLLYATLPVAALVAVLVCAAAHLAIERPGIALGKRLAGKPREKFSRRIEQATLDVAP